MIPGAWYASYSFGLVLWRLDIVRSANALSRLANNVVTYVERAYK